MTINKLNFRANPSGISAATDDRSQLHRSQRTGDVELGWAKWAAAQREAGFDWPVGFGKQENPVLASPSAQSGEPDRLVFKLL